MGTPERDLIGNATVLINGLPTITFPPAPYHRTITCIVVTNGVASTMNLFRGLLGSAPAATTTAGQNNTYNGAVSIPAGQTIFVQWSAAANPLSLATVRLSLERDDNPLDAASSGGDWVNKLITSLDVPNNGPPFIHFGDAASLPPQIVAYYLTGGPFAAAPITVTAGLVFEQDANTWIYMVLCLPTFGRPFLAIGGMESVGLVISEWGRYTPGTLGANTFATIPGPMILTNPVGGSPGFLRIELGYDLVVDAGMGGRSFGRGILDITADTSTTGFFGPAETAVQFSNSITFRNGRAFEAIWVQDVDSGSANVFAGFNLRRNNIGGTVLRFAEGLALGPAGFACTAHGRAIFINNSGANITDTLLLTATASGVATIRLNGASVGVAGNRARVLWVRDIGAAGDYSFAPQL